MSNNIESVSNRHYVTTRSLQQPFREVNSETKNTVETVETVFKQEEDEVKEEKRWFKAYFSPIKHSVWAFQSHHMTMLLVIHLFAKTKSLVWVTFKDIFWYLAFSYSVDMSTIWIYCWIVAVFCWVNCSISRLRTWNKCLKKMLFPGPPFIHESHTHAKD